MANKINAKLKKTIDDFYLMVVDDFKEAEGIIINDSKFSNMFRKKDYDRNIRKLRSCKKKCIALDMAGLVSESDAEEQQLLTDFERARYAFVALCDAHISLQQNLKDKSEGAKVKYSEYKELYNRMQKSRTEFNSQLHELDIDYTDYTYDLEEDGEEHEYLSYEDVNR